MPRAVPTLRRDVKEGSHVTITLATCESRMVQSVAVTFSSTIHSPLFKNISFRSPPSYNISSQVSSFLQCLLPVLFLPTVSPPSSPPSLSNFS
ncbi:hypothetical protein Pcinc_002720 [Petrolisthes cinctipes]|uniref:Uncharacterized protein n=1 Tax=Petrolisthes cinctipes TaxID=88211 RepID=A0AAE1GJ46_PETCI|nr:hypothetical protein Pcinc_002720 [Petrolisthes cinctipes]